ARKRFLFRTRSLALAFKRCYLRRLRRLYAKDALIFPGKTAAYATPEAFTRLLTDAAAKQWIVYAKRPFAGPAQVLRYLGRYTHRVAISNSRIKSLHNDQVVFAYRDRAHQNRKKHMTLPAVEFIRRFMLHVLPDGFMKIRYYGFLSHRHKKRNIALIRNLIDPGGHYPAKIHETLETIMQRLTGRDIKQCPQCGQGKLYKAPLPVNKHPPHVEPADTS
ncbi:MAG: transposase, partial [Pseudomonadota bacterium]|nr:transposase [Pseudomonadota bacterium]